MIHLYTRFDQALHRIKCCNGGLFFAARLSPYPARTAALLAHKTTHHSALSWWLLENLNSWGYKDGVPLYGWWVPKPRTCKPSSPPSIRTWLPPIRQELRGPLRFISSCGYKERERRSVTLVACLSLGHEHRWLALKEHGKVRTNIV